MTDLGTRGHPYIGLPDYQFWKNEPGIQEPGLFDPVTSTSFVLTKDEPVVTAGSCFAQHVARYLANSGFNFLLTEKCHPLFSSEVGAAFNFNTFSARYGNIYTARQMKQLIQRAYGEFVPLESAWVGKGGRIVDPFRPQIQKRGFVNEQELICDREVHFAAVRSALEQMSVFVFTLGLTEAWIDARDGAVFPIAPGVAGGQFDAEKYSFRNFEINEIVADFQWCLDRIRSVNPEVKVILTVSPVPLNATALDRHVFTSTTYSKSVLRVAAEQICRSNALCDYFPSYEIITSPYARGRYYGPDCREVNDEGVKHVMSLFLKHYGDVQPDALPERDVDNNPAISEHIKQMQKIVEVLCDEEAITNR